MRQAKDTDFFIELPDVGVFRFGRRTYGDRLNIRAEYLRLVREFGDSDSALSIYASMIASHSVLCVEAPPGWENLTELDMTSPVDPEEKLFELYELLKAKEDSFRRGQDQNSKATGQGAS
jgi:hypothetical protein